MVENGWLTPTEAGKLLGVSRETARKWAKSGQLDAHVTEDREWRISKESVEQRLAQTSAPDEPLPATQAPSLPQTASLELLVDAVAKAFVETNAPVQVQMLSILEEQLRHERERADRAEARLEAERSRGFFSRLFGG